MNTVNQVGSPQTPQGQNSEWKSPVSQNLVPCNFYNICFKILDHFFLFYGVSILEEEESLRDVSCQNITNKSNGIICNYLHFWMSKPGYFDSFNLRDRSKYVSSFCVL